jgi:hypothetical protein
MRNVLGRLLAWVVEILDRNLITVPDIDMECVPAPNKC